jgi:hypothetical protein
MSPEEFQIAKLQLRAGDVLIVKVANLLSVEAAQRLHSHIDSVVPAGVKVLVVGSDIDLSMLTAEEIQARAA